MNRFALFLFVLVTAGASSAAPAEKFGEHLSALKSALAAEKSPSLSGAQIGQLIGTLKQLFETENYYTAAQKLTDFRDSHRHSPHAVEIVDTFILAVRTEHDAQNRETDSKVAGIRTAFRHHFATHAPLKDFDPLLDQIEQLVRHEQRWSQFNRDNGVRFASIQNLRTLIVRWQDYLLAIEKNESLAASLILDELTNSNGLAETLPRSELLNLQLAARNRALAKNEELFAIYRQKSEAILARVPDMIAHARQAAELDPILTELAATKPPSTSAGDYPIGSPAAQFSFRLEATRRFLSQWQSYLSSLAAGDRHSAQQTLIQLANDGSAYEYVYPRSLILARLTPPMAGTSAPSDPTITVATMLRPEAVTLETLDRFAEQLRDIYPKSEVVTELAARVATLRTNKSQLDQGDTHSLLTFGNIPSDPVKSLYASAFARIHRQLLMRAVQLQINGPADLQPIADELPANYVQRVIQVGRASRDWQLIYRALQTLHTSPGGFWTPDLSTDLAGFRSFFAGLNLELAGQITPAVRSYLASLRTAGPNLPIDEIGRRLKELKDTYPAEFATAQNTPDPNAVNAPLSPTRPDPRADLRTSVTPPISAPPPSASAPRATPTPPRAP